MTAAEKITAINATADRLAGGYQGPAGTQYCDTLPTIREIGGKYEINDGTGQCSPEVYPSAEAAVEAALLWFASCMVGYTVTDLDDPRSADSIAVALGDRGSAWDRFRGFDA